MWFHSFLLSFTFQKRPKQKNRKKKRNKNKRQQNKNAEVTFEEDGGGGSHDDENDKMASGSTTGKDYKKGKSSADLSSSAENGERNDSKNLTLSSSTATATAVSSKATTVHRRVGKKSRNHQQREEGKNARLDKKNSNKHRADYPPQEPLSERIALHMQRLRPLVIQGASFMATFSTSMATKCVKLLISFCPNKERFWFFVPMFCIGMDLFFLSLSIISAIVGKLVYITLLLHKLALLELLEFESASICYTLIFFYPSIILGTKDLLPFEEYWTVFLRWFVVDRWFCRPIKMKNTFLNRIKDSRRPALHRSKFEKETKVSTIRKIGRFIMRSKEKEKFEDTERVTMANQILLIFRKITPLILMIEVNVRREGFLMSMSRTERILFSYGVAVIRSGYLFSPLIWMSWTLQLTVIMFAPASGVWAYFLMVVGLSAIRLSHYTASVEDMEGIYVSYKDDNSSPRKEIAD